MNLSKKIISNFLKYFLFFSLYSSALGQPPPPYLTHSTWAKSIYFRGYDPNTKERLTDKMLVDFALKLKRYKVGTVYIFAGPFQKDGHLPCFAFSTQARNSVMRIKELYPNVKILPWVGGIQDKTVRLESEKWVKNSLKSAIKLLKMPYDGVHVDFEYIHYPKSKASKLDLKKYDEGWVRFHRLLREALPTTFISTAVVSTADLTKPWKHKHNLSDLIETARTVNQIAIMFYDTNLHETEIYQKALSQQLQQIQKIKAALLTQSPEILLGVGTFISTKALMHYRDMRFENIPTTLNALKSLQQELSPKNRLVDGLAVYCDWQSRSTDWSEIEKGWSAFVSQK